MTETIEIRDVGPIERLSIPVPTAGGIVVLRGCNGSGKSHALQAVSALIGSARKPPTRDGSLGAMVEGLGARLTIGRRAAVAGEVEVAHLDGEDPSLLVDPGIKSADAADAERVRALLRLSRARVELAAFAKLVGGEERLRELCRVASLDQIDDVPAMAAAIKRDLEVAARRAEQAAENLLQKAKGIRDTLGELGGAKPPGQSAELARAAHTDAVRAQSAAHATQQQNRKLREAAARAGDALAAMGDDGTADTIETKARAHAEAQSARARIQSEVIELERRLAQLQSELKAAKGAVDAAGRELEQHERARDQRSALQQAITAASGAADADPEQLAQLGEAVEHTRADVEAWGVFERTERVRSEIVDIEQRGTEAMNEGASLRAAARGTEAVLLEVMRSVCGDNIELSDGRLYVRTDRGKELFCELSQGERWRIALDIAVKSVGNHGLLVVRQDAYEALDPINRREVAEYARALGVVILTAQAEDGEIRAEVA